MEVDIMGRQVAESDTASGTGLTVSPSGPMINEDGMSIADYMSLGYTFEQARALVTGSTIGLPKETSGYGGGSSVDHYNEVSANTQAGLDEDKRQFDATQGLNEQKFAADEAERKRQAALDERNMALSQGNLDLAKQKQADANHWEEVGAAIQREQIAQQAQGQQLQFQASMAQVAQQREDSDKRFQVGMAGATNDKQRNEIEARWNAEQAQIAKMEDETKRVLGGQANQINQFGAETDRAARMGTLALDNNKFIAEMARSPRDLPGLFMMQRGVAPDWQTLINGGTPGQGASLIPSDVMGAYKPVTAPVSFNGTPANAAAAGVGSNTAAGIAASQAANPFIVAGGSVQQAQQPRPQFVPQPTPQVIPYGNDQISRPLPAQDNPHNNIMRYYTPGLAADGPQYDRQIDTDYRAEGGYTTAKHVVAGDAPDPNPMAGGALPEGIYNPTGAPLFIQPNPKTAAMLASYGARRFALGTDNSGAYAANGMAGSWINTSPNDYANSQNTPLPPALKALADYGYPISPSIYSSATGNIAPTLNVADAYRQRGGGTLFGLQTLNGMSPAEQEAQRGISEGVVGVPWQDLIDYVSRGTAGLKSAQQARAA